MARKDQPRANLQQRKKSADDLANKKKARSKANKKSRRELRAETLRNTSRNVEIAAMYKRDSIRKRRQSKVLPHKKNKDDTKNRKVTIDDGGEVTSPGKRLTFQDDFHVQKMPQKPVVRRSIIQRQWKETDIKKKT